MIAKKTLTIIVLVFLFLPTIFAQSKFVQGKVTTFDSILLMNASIKVKSTNQVVLSDTNGYFSLICNTPDKFIISANGFVTKRFKVKKETKLVLINLQLQSNDEAQEIAIGYGHIKDREKLFAMNSLHNKEEDFSRYKDVFNIISGRFPGVEVFQGEIRIRGISSTHGNGALLILDGMQVNESTIRSLSTQSIKSINVLKGNAASIYGVYATNGVVVIETK
ncbi:MAG: TonB-dependent receptor plug domain-containing protein [Mariniphaga sp.]|nr:TonB-dependent receptor plug domain-containing protein [Mariniphaga sp.]